MIINDLNKAVVKGFSAYKLTIPVFADYSSIMFNILFQIPNKPASLGELTFNVSLHKNLQPLGSDFFSKDFYQLNDFGSCVFRYADLNKYFIEGELKVTIENDANRKFNCNIDLLYGNKNAELHYIKGNYPLEKISGIEDYMHDFSKENQSKEETDNNII